MKRLATFPSRARYRMRHQHDNRWLFPIATSALLLPFLVGAALILALEPSRSFVEAQAAIDQRASRLSADVPGSGRLDQGIPQTATIRSRDGTVLGTVNDAHHGRRTSVRLGDISVQMIAATLAAEDRRYFEHSGVDTIGLARAITQNLQDDGVSSGASTIEMQLARNLFLVDERTEQTLARKVREAAVALQLDRVFTKPDILEAYLNVVYYGANAHGVEAAAQTYFAKSARDLTLSESALIAGLTQSPTVLNPLKNPDGARERQRYVLDHMVASKVVTAEEADEAWASPLDLVGFATPDRLAPHWVDYIQQYVRRAWGPEALYLDGLDVTTSIDLDVQRMAERIVAANEDLRRRVGANNTAVVVLDAATSQVLAMVGSKDFNDRSIDGEVNVALAGRQPGSSIKPVVYLAGFERGLNPSLRVADEITPFSAPPGQPSYVPSNYENKYYGNVSLRDALGNSLNVPAVKVLKYVGVPSFLDLARRLGITSLDGWDPRWLSLTLGGGEVSLLELTGAYATVARLGEYRPTQPLVRVKSARGARAYDVGPQSGAQVVDPRVAYQLLHVMGDVGARRVAFGDASPLNLPRPHMVKTGTTDDYRDTWTVGCVPQVCVGVWVGNTRNTPMVQASSSLTAGKIWVDTINALVERSRWAPEPFPVPSGLVFKRIPSSSGARPGARDYEEVFLPGSEQTFDLKMDWMQPTP